MLPFVSNESHSNFDKTILIDRFQVTETPMACKSSVMDQ